MTDLFKTSKVISALPSVIEPNTTYWVRTGLGFDLYLSDSTGSTVHKINGTPPYIPVPYNFTVNGDATLNTSISQTSDVTAAITLANSGVTAGTYGSSTEVPAIIVDLKGRVTKVTKTPIRTSSITQSGIVQLSVATNSTSVSTAATSSAVKATYDLALAAIPNSKFGTALGVATLDATGKIPSVQLPSYVDDVMEFATEFAFPNPGETGKLYVDLSSNKLFRWTGTTYVNISGGSEIADASLKLYTARSFSLIGGATSDIVNFDGTGNVTLTINGLNPDTLTKAVPIVKGGTGAITAAAARTNLGLGTAATKNVGGVNGLVELSGSKVPNANLPEASVTQAGIVQLSDNDESESTNTAPTSKIVKELRDFLTFIFNSFTNFSNSKAKADGIASLDGSGKLPASQLTTHSHPESTESRQINRMFYNVLEFEASDTPLEIIIKTKLPFIHGHAMPMIHIVGYAYGAAAPIELKIGYYVYDGAFVNSGVICLGAWNPDVKLFKYTDAGQEYVGIGLAKSIYYPRFSISYSDIWSGETRDYSKNWTAEYTAASTSIINNYTNITQIPYKRIHGFGEAAFVDTGNNSGNVITVDQYGLNSTFKSGQASTGEANPNDIRTNGMVYCNDTAAAGWNSDGALYSQFHSNIWGHEIYGDYRTGNISVRGLNSGTWSSWKQIATKQDINNLVNFTHVGATAPSTGGLAVNSVWLDTSTEV